MLLVLLLSSNAFQYAGQRTCGPLSLLLLSLLLLLTLSATRGPMSSTSHTVLRLQFTFLLVFPRRCLSCTARGEGGGGGEHTQFFWHSRALFSSHSRSLPLPQLGTCICMQPRKSARPPSSHYALTQPHTHTHSLSPPAYALHADTHTHTASTACLALTRLHSTYSLHALMLTLPAHLHLRLLHSLHSLPALSCLHSLLSFILSRCG